LPYIGHHIGPPKQYETHSRALGLENETPTFFRVLHGIEPTFSQERKRVF